MDNISQQFKQAFQLRKDKKINGAIAIYEPLWKQDTSVFGEWDGWSYGQCLRENHNYREALAVCRQLYPRFKTSGIICGLYAWTIYYTELATDQRPSSKEAFVKVINAIVQLSPPGHAFSPAVKSIFKLVKYLAEGNPDNWDEIGVWLSKLEKNKLNKETYSIDVPGHRKMELASELEEWYSWQSKWLLQTGQWEKCAGLCSEALDELDKWHYSNEIWFARRKAASLTQLGQKLQALEILKSLVKRKREWFMIADLADLTEDRDEALRLYAEAALLFGDLPKKIRVFYKMSELCVIKGDKELAHLHALLVYVLRCENNWPVPPELEQMLRQPGEAPDKIPESVSLVQKLKPYWQKLTSGTEINTEGKQRLNGKIDHFIGGGHAGFIKPEDGANKVYFLFKNFHGNSKELKPGLRVSYETNKSFDKKKNRESEMAVRVRKNL